MSLRKALGAVLAVEILILVYAYLSYSGSLGGLQATTRYSGRFSFLIFSVLFLFNTSNKNQLVKILSPKPYHVFAFAHGIHLIELLLFVYISGAELIPYRLAGGFLAYVFIFSMPIVLEYQQVRKIEWSKLKTFELVYSFYIWLIFFMSYLPRIIGTLPNVGGSYQEFVVLFSWVLIMLIIKLVMVFKDRQTTLSKSF